MIQSHLTAFGLTDVGLERKNNEDALVIDEANGFFAVCDGMGGHASGEIASRVAAETMQDFIAEKIHADNFRWPYLNDDAMTEGARVLDNAVRLANKRVFEAAKGNPRHKGMGTTIVALYVGPHHLVCCHVGDSRLYRLRDDQMELLTQDHSLLNHYKRTRSLTLEQEQNFKGKNVIVRAVGLRDTVQPELNYVDWRPGDSFLLCSDGLTDLVPDDILHDQMRAANVDMQAATKALIRAALTRGGKDNVTVLMLQTREGRGPLRAPPQMDSSAVMQDTNPELDVAGPEGSWDLETLPGYDAPTAVSTAAHNQTAVPDLSHIPPPPGAREPIVTSVDSTGAVIPPPPSGPRKSSRPRLAALPEQATQSRPLAVTRSTRPPAPENPFHSPAEAPTQAATQSPTVEEQQASPTAVVSVDVPTSRSLAAFMSAPTGQHPVISTQPSEDAVTPDATVAVQEDTPSELENIFTAPTQRMRSVPRSDDPSER